MEAYKARQLVDLLESLPSHQCHPVVLRVLRQLIAEVTEGDMPAADEHLRHTSLRVG